MTLSIANKQLTITAPGDANAQVSWDLSPSGTDLVPSGLDTLGGIVATLKQRGVFAVTADPNMKTAVKSEDLADVSSQDIKSAAYTLTMDKTRLMNDELTWSKSWMNANLVGIGGNRSVSLSWNASTNAAGYNVYRSGSSGGPYSKIADAVTNLSYVDYQVSAQQVWYYVVTAVNQAGESGNSNQVSATIPGGWVYVYPGSYEDTSTEAIAVAAGYAGARGGGVMQPSPNAATVLGTGVNVQNILSQGVAPNFQNLSDAQLVQQTAGAGLQVGRVGSSHGSFLSCERTLAAPGGRAAGCAEGRGGDADEQFTAGELLARGAAGCRHHVLRGFDHRRASGFATRADVAASGSGRRAGLLSTNMTCSESTRRSLVPDGKLARRYLCRSSEDM